jgi:beta-galactosidase
MSLIFGVDYYPEHWEKERWKQDFRRMRSMGFTAVRLMEFAWASLEPKEGVFDFSLFDEVVSMAENEGLKLVLGTPTATFPIWLFEKNPGIVQRHPSGMLKDFGNRRQACLNAPVYLEAVERIVSVVAEHFGQNPNIVGWQIDNEVGHEGSDRCICENCRMEWHRWLERKYVRIEDLNRVWGTVFWSTTYMEFDQVPVPRLQVGTAQNPSLQLDYDRFCSDSAVEFVRMQAELLRKRIRPEQWLTTNLYPTPHSPVIDMEELFSSLDMVSYDNYPVWGDQDEPMPYFAVSYILSYIRGLKPERQFSIMEQFTGIQGHACLGYLPPPQQVRLWTNQAIAHGADSIFYFRWRTARFGQEQLCYGLHLADDQPIEATQELVENIQKNSSSFASFVHQPVPAEACLLYDKDNARLFKEQYLSQGMVLKPSPHMQIGYDAEMIRAYSPFSIFNVNADVRSVSSVDLTKYRFVSLPLYQMVDPGFVRELERWVEKGGHLIIGWRSGVRDLNNYAVQEPLPGLFTELAGIKITGFESLNKNEIPIRIGAIPAKGGVWADLLTPYSAKPLGYYTDKKRHYRGTPCVTMNQYGRGVVYYLGTSPNPIGIFLLYRSILKKAGLKPKYHGMGVEVVHRRSQDGRELNVILNHTAKNKRVRGERVSPYGTVIKQF